MKLNLILAAEFRCTIGLVILLIFVKVFKNMWKQTNPVLTVAIAAEGSKVYEAIWSIYGQGCLCIILPN